MMEREYLLIGGHRNGQTIITNGTDRIRFPYTVDYKDKPVSTYLSPMTLVTYMIEEYKLEKCTLDDGKSMEVYRFVDLSNKEVTDLLMDKINNE